MTDPTNRADEREAIRRALAKKFDAFRSTQPGPEALIAADFALAETHALREDFEHVTKRLDDAKRELRCPDCGCADQIDAESSECGCDSPICARDGSKTLAEEYIALRQAVADLTTNRDTYARDLRHAKEEIGKLHSAIAKRESERDALREENERLLVMVDKLNGATREGAGDASLAVTMFLALNKELQVGDNPEKRLHVDHLWKLVQGRAALVRENVALRLRVEELMGALNEIASPQPGEQSFTIIRDNEREAAIGWAAVQWRMDLAEKAVKRAALAPPPQAAKEKETCGGSSSESSPASSSQQSSPTSSSSQPINRSRVTGYP